MSSFVEWTVESSSMCIIFHISVAIVLPGLPTEHFEENNV